MLNEVAFILVAKCGSNSIEKDHIEATKRDQTYRGKWGNGFGHF
jgi:hypothetical protein